jgi:hypothetical protein
VTAQPTEDAADPLVILRDLPELEREEFLRQYHQAVDAAHTRRVTSGCGDSSMCGALPPSPPGYYEELAAVRTGTATTVPVTDAIPDWAERVAATRDHR